MTTLEPITIQGIEAAQPITNEKLLATAGKLSEIQRRYFQNEGIETARYDLGEAALVYSKQSGLEPSSTYKKTFYPGGSFAETETVSIDGDHGISFAMDIDIATPGYGPESTPNAIVDFSITHEDNNSGVGIRMIMDNVSIMGSAIEIPAVTTVEVFHKGIKTHQLGIAKSGQIAYARSFDYSDVATNSESIIPADAKSHPLTPSQPANEGQNILHGEVVIDRQKLDSLVKSTSNPDLLAGLNDALGLKLN